MERIEPGAEGARQFIKNSNQSLRILPVVVGRVGITLHLMLMRTQPKHAEQGPDDRATERGSILSLLPIMGVIFIAFLIIGFALPVLPLHVHLDLGLSTFVVGIVSGSQFAAALLSRMWGGREADKRGAKRAVILGLLAAIGSGALYLASVSLDLTPGISAGILLLGRALLGGAESFIITGAAAWGLTLAGRHNAGRVIAWVGMAMFAAMALGGPIGTLLYRTGGFAAVALATMLVPLATLLLVAPLKPVFAPSGAATGFMGVMKSVWMPGVGSALSSIGFGAMITFSSLLATERAWTPIWLPFTAFGAALVAARMFLGQVPDRTGGAKVALVFVFVEAAGLALLSAANGPIVAAIGSALAGFGYSLVYPGLGVEAVSRVPAQSRGLAMGAYTVFLDVALGFGSPALGVVAGHAGFGAVFLVASAAVLCAAAFAARLLILSRRRLA